MANCQLPECDKELSHQRVSRKAIYHSDKCREKALYQRRIAKEKAKHAALVEKAYGRAPESPLAAEMAQIDAEEATEAAEAVERQAAKPKPRKKGNRPGDKPYLAGRDILKVPGVVKGRHPKDPDGYYWWCSPQNLETALYTEGITYASRRVLEIGPAQHIPGVSQGTNPDHIRARELVFLRRPYQHHLDKRRLNEYLTDQNSPSIPDGALEKSMGDIKLARPGSFGKRGSEWAVANRKRLEQQQQEEEEEA